MRAIETREVEFLIVGEIAGETRAMIPRGPCFAGKVLRAESPMSRLNRCPRFRKRLGGLDLGFGRDRESAGLPRFSEAFVELFGFEHLKTFERTPVGLAFWSSRQASRLPRTRRLLFLTRFVDARRTRLRRVRYPVGKIWPVWVLKVGMGFDKADAYG